MPALGAGADLRTTTTHCVTLEMLRLGIHGRGMWGQRLLATLESIPMVEAMPLERGALVRSDLDGVIIATPAETHTEIALPYILAGVPTFIEKPMTTSVSDADRIADAARRSNTFVFVGYIQLYNPAFQTALRLIQSLGQLRYVLFQSMNNRPRNGTSALWDWLPHHLSMADAIFGAQPASVSATSLYGEPLIEAATSHLMYGTVSVFSIVSWHSPIRIQQTTICGEMGTLILDDRVDTKLVLYGAGGHTSFPEYESEFPLMRELRSFLAILKSGRIDHAHVDLSRSIARTISSAETSVLQGGARQLISIGRT